MSTNALSPSAERQRRFRYRRKNDLLLVTVEVPMQLVDQLIGGGLITEENALDREALGRAIVVAAEQLIDGSR
jgi:hypothetical protein